MGLKENIIERERKRGEREREREREGAGCLEHLNDTCGVRRCARASTTAQGEGVAEGNDGGRRREWRCYLTQAHRFGYRKI